MPSWKVLIIDLLFRDDAALATYTNDYLQDLMDYRWIPLKADFLGAWKSVWLKHYPVYPIIIISLIIQRNLAKKIRAKWESGLTAVRLKRDPPVLLLS